ncbi:Crp/Fnr family transcriptional regulator [Sphingomonas sanguinis]|uniref:Crp/Fnr family transcriptional regulator n=1 Tax=Sphingomonas sp. LC-1 TaxID=3110957 RepID=UPI0021BB9554|nr:Crp/Fnr family transcriptional regulator [Sphingomonas sp. LC-1]MCT8002240.1 Crp/Fnr family transcriptional regulator [Sphingomonas sp. LC-1]
MIQTKICADCAVRDHALCGSLDDRELKVLNELGQRRHVARGQTVVWSGDEAVVCGNVLSGVLKLVAGTADGREQIVGLLYQADFFGQPYAGVADFTTVALSDAELCVFPRAAFQNVLEEHPRMEHLLLQRTFASLNEARGRMLVLARQSASEKLAGFLVDVAGRLGEKACNACPDTPVRFDLPLTRGQIADVLGMTIETVSRQLTRLKEAGVIALPGGRAITIMDGASLAARAEAA